MGIVIHIDVSITPDRPNNQDQVTSKIRDIEHQETTTPIEVNYL